MFDLGYQILECGLFFFPVQGCGYVASSLAIFLLVALCESLHSPTSLHTPVIGNSPTSLHTETSALGMRGATIGKSLVSWEVH